MFKKVYSLYSAFCTQPAFYSQSVVCMLHSVCTLPLVRSLQFAVHSLRFTLTGYNSQMKKTVLMKKTQGFVVDGNRLPGNP